MSTKPIIYLVPGAYHKPSSYTHFINLAQSHGYTILSNTLGVNSDDASSATNLAGKDYRADVANIHSVLLPELDKGHTAIIMAHSYGGLGGAAAIEGQTIEDRSARGLKGGIVGFIAVAALAYPVRNKGFLGDETQFDLQHYHQSKDGLVSITPGARPLWFSDIPDAESLPIFNDFLKYQSFKAFNAWPHFIAKDAKVTRAYVLTENDTALEPQWQEGFVQAGDFHHVFRVQSGHAPFHKVPERLVEILDEVVKVVEGKAQGSK